MSLRRPRTGGESASSSKRRKKASRSDDLLEQWTNHWENFGPLIDILEKYSEDLSIGSEQALTYVKTLRQLQQRAIARTLGPRQDLVQWLETLLRQYIPLNHLDDLNDDPEAISIKVNIADGKDQLKRIINTLNELLFEQDPERAVDALRAAALAPSTAAKPLHLREHQVEGEQDAIYHGRPSNLTGAYLSVYHPIFQTFAERHSAPIDFEQSKEKFGLVHQLLTACAEYYERETDLQTAIAPILEALLGAGVATIATLFSDKTEFKPDGHLAVICELYPPGHHGRSGMCKLFLEIKPGVGTGACDPTDQGLKDYYLCCIQKSLTQLRQSTCMPAFILSIAGPYTKVSGAIYVQGVVSATLARCSEALPEVSSSTLDGPYATQYDEQVWRTVHMLQTLRSCLDLLDEYYANLRIDMPRDPLSPSPCFKSFKIDDIDATITYLSHHLNKPRSDRALFLANATIGEETHKCIVKFTKWYGSDAHKIMQKEGVAAELLYCEWVESIGLWVVITKYYDALPKAIPSPDGIGRLRDALGVLHEQGFVHGDVRHPNILVDLEGWPRLIDFDWSRPNNTIRYPACLSTEYWPPEIKPGDLIKAEHDLIMLDRYEQKRWWT